MYKPAVFPNTAVPSMRPEVPASASEFVAMIKSNIAVMGKLVKAAGIEPE